ncbi:hypothetical protein LTR66_003144 [Elasticomyces elasticus]|nr:hypothetical protein LTR66_003144 [Elasticomyces elasticus]
MDVRQWLASTMEAERPKSLTALGFPDFLRGRADAQNAETVDRQNDHKRRWTASGSSILEVAAPRKHRGHRGHETSRDRKRHRGGSDSTQFVSTCPSQSSSPSLGSSTQNRQPAKTYERKARHKTRTDRYEPKIDTSKRRTARREKKSTEKRRKTKKTRENLSTGLVQSFHAKNVPKNRLTLKPSANLGIFKKGRASSPRRGRGLPDLVFSEMRFLQKPKEQPEEQQNAPASKHKNKKDRKRVEEEEISAFFGPKKSAPGQQAHAIPAKRVTSRRHASVLSQQSDSLARSDVKPKPIRQSDELPEKQFLGFGSKGAKPDSAGSLPWSVSVHTPPSPLPHFQRAAATIEIGQLAGHPPKHAIHHDAMCCSIEGQRQSVANDRCHTSREESTEREILVASTHVGTHRIEAFQPDHERAAVMSEREHFVPKNPTGTRAKRLNTTIEVHEDYPNSARQLSATYSTAIHTHHSCQEECGAKEMAIHQHFASSDNKENADPSTSSSPLGRILRHCDEAVSRSTKESFVPLTRPQHQMASSSISVVAGHAQYTDGVEPLICPRSADRRTFLSNILEDYDTDIGVPHEEQALRNLDYGQSEMQQFLEHRLEEPPPQPLFYDEHELLGEPHLTDFVYDHPVQAADTQVQDYHAVQEEEPLRNEAQVEQSPELSREDYSRAEDDVDDVFAGFWRPHKLY